MTTMRHLRAVLLRLLAFVRRDRHELDLAAEIESNLQFHVDDNVRAGMTPEQARRQAILALGGIEQAKEQYRDRRGLPGLDALVQDVRFGARMLRKHKAFTAAAVLTLAIGFGPPIAIVTFANWMVLRPIPGVRDSGDVSFLTTGAPNVRGSFTVGRVSYPNLRDATTRLRTVELAALQAFPGASVAGNGRPERSLNGQFVSGSYFDVLGVQVQAGRAIGPDDDDPASPALVAVISDATWASLFDRRPAAIGQTITVDGHSVTVIGVADRAFRGAQRVLEDAFWMPGVSEPILRALEGRRPDDRATGGYYQFLARPASGATWPQAEAELASLTGWLREQYPEDNEKFSTVGFRNDGPIDMLQRDRFVALSALMLGASLLVLIIASSNVASLVVMRGIARREEVAVRRALGAGRWRVLRQHVTEAMLLWLLGAAAATSLVWTLVRADAGTRLVRFGIPFPQGPVDWHVAAFAVGLALLVGLVFSIVPAWRATIVEPASTLQTMSATATRRLRAAPVLTALQLSASLTLLVGALMLAVTLRNVMAIDLGFEPDNVTVFRAQAPAGASEEASYAHLREFESRLAARPGVRSVAMADGAPFAAGRNIVSRVRRGPADEYVDASMQILLTSDYFSTLRIPLLRGRTLTEEEMPAPGRADRPAAVLSASLARRLFGTIDVIGRTVEQPAYEQPPQIFEIVGIAADVRFDSLTEPPPPVIYRARGLGGTRRDASLIVRTTTAVPLAPEIRAVAQSLGSPPPNDIITMNDAIARRRGEWDLLAGLMAALAIVAIVVSSVGVYGVVAFAAASRRAEFGIRMALGASAAMVRRHVLRGAAWMTVAGLAFGLGGAFGLMQVLQHRLVGVSPLDPVIWGSAAMLLVALVVMASIVPVRQATRVSLADTLKAL